MNEVIVLMHEDTTQYLLSIFKDYAAAARHVEEFYPDFQPVVSGQDYTSTWLRGSEKILALPIEVKE